MVLGLKTGDILRLKKRHPCGGWLWTVTRLGADIGMVCQECGRYVMMPRSQLAGGSGQWYPGKKRMPARGVS